MKKLLFFKIKYLCHKSNEVFVDSLAAEFEKLGVQVTICDIIDENDIENKLNQLVSKEFDAMIDFNSVLPNVDMEEGGYFLDKINAPFYNFVVDHPLFHHEFLKLPLENYNVISIDNNHKNFIRRFYPHIKNVIVNPLPPTKGALKVPYKNRNIEVLYPLSYVSLKTVEKHYRASESLNGIIKLNKFEKKVADDMVDIMLNNPFATLEFALNKVLADRKASYEDGDLRALFFKMHIVDVYVRTYLREKMMDCLLKAGNTVTACGKDWDKYENKWSGKLKIYPDVHYLTAMQYMQNSKAVVNVTPGFKCGLHDRATSAMLNECLMISDVSINDVEAAKDNYDFSKLYIKNNATIWYSYNIEDMQRAAEELRGRLKKPESYEEDRIKNAEFINEALSFRTLAENILNNI